MRIVGITAVFLVSCLLTACAGLNATPVGGASGASEEEAHGFRYYQPAPYLFVHSDGKGGLISEIKYLPDTTQKMSVQPYAYLASNDSTLEFDGGMLTHASATVDETVVPKAALDSLAKVLGAAAASVLNAPGATQDNTVPVPYLFRIVIDGDNIYLNGGPADGAALDTDGKNKMVITVTIAKKEGK